jgi:hypothetical protein
VRKAALYAATWLATAGVATAIGIAAVQAVGDAARGRGPLGPAVETRPEADTPTLPNAAALAGLPEVSEVVLGIYGSFVVSCRGPYAHGVRVDPAPGWHAISFEPGPDDDVDALFARGDRSLEVEVFCNRGRPTVADVEHNEFAGRW